MNDQLLQLYSRYWDGMIQNIYKPNMETEHACSYPLLIQVTPLYQNASKRIMFCGQETQVWGIEHPNPETTHPQDLLSIYNNFVNKNNRGETLKKPGYNSPYWNFQWRIIQKNPNVGYVFQNVVKIGKQTNAGCDDVIYNATKQYFPVWREELNILKPDLIVFLTGPNYDKRIQEVVGSFVTEHISGVDGLLDKIIFDDKTMPMAIRTNHPRNLQQNKKYFAMSDAISDIIARL